MSITASAIFNLTKDWGELEGIGERSEKGGRVEESSEFGTDVAGRHSFGRKVFFPIF